VWLRAYNRGRSVRFLGSGFSGVCVRVCAVGWGDEIIFFSSVRRGGAEPFYLLYNHPKHLANIDLSQIIPPPPHNNALLINLRPSPHSILHLPPLPPNPHLLRLLHTLHPRPLPTHTPPHAPHPPNTRPHPHPSSSLQPPRSHRSTPRISMRCWGDACC